MSEILLPFGKELLKFAPPPGQIPEVLVPRPCPASVYDDEEAIVLQALRQPVAAPTLRELARSQKRIAIVTSDHTRPVPSHITMPILLKELRAGNPAAEITIIIATGSHRVPSEQELVDKFGEEVVTRERLVSHRSTDMGSMAYLGEMPGGERLFINRLAQEADLLIAEGFIEPHFFAGFSGGRKSIFPGIAENTAILRNHCAENIAHPKAKAGILDGNPIHAEMLHAAEMSGLSFILNTVLDKDKRIVAAFAGHYDLAHRKGCEYVARRATVRTKKSDVVVATNGGYPLDQNIYQTVKGMVTAEAACKDKGIIIMLSQCADGVGGDSFYNTFARDMSPQAILEEILTRSPADTIPDQWQSQILAKVLSNRQVILVTQADKRIVEDMKMQWAPSLEEALLMASYPSQRKSLTIIPDGISVIVEEKERAEC